MSTASGSAGHRYEILTKLAEGGMAEIFLAREGNAHVVLKRVSREHASDTQYVRMFLDEAALAAQLSHPNVAQVFDIGRLGTSYFFTMEYVHGVTVQALVDRARDKALALPIAAVLAVVAGAAAGLGHAHTRRGPDGRPLDIIHRDVSPSNLMVSFSGQVKIVDFGIAKATFTPETVAGEIKGKVSYLSPEQTRQRKLDRRSDLFSLGIVAWEMLTGRRLFKRGNMFETLAAIATEQAPPPSTARTDLPAAVDELVAKMLALEPDDRYQTADDLIAAVEQTGHRTIAAMSEATLARLLRELFGVVPEPWRLVEGEGIAVASAPIPEELDSHDPDDPPDPVDRLLETTQLTSVSIATMLEQRPDDVEEPSLTTNVMVADGEGETRMVPLLANAAPSRIESDLPPDPLADTAEWRPDPAAEAPTLIAPPPIEDPELAAPVAARSVPNDVADGVTLMGSGAYRPQPRPSRPSPAIPGSGPRSAPAFAAPPEVTPAEPRGRIPLRWWILGGSLLGVALMTILVIATRDVELVVPPPRDAARVVVIDAAPLIDFDDAAVDTAVPVDAAADASIDTGVAVDAAPDDFDVLTRPGPRPRRRRPLRSPGDLDEGYRAGRFRDVVAACAKLGAFTEKAVACTLAACQIRRVRVAQTWFRDVAPALRDRTIAECKRHGATIVDVR